MSILLALPLAGCVINNVRPVSVGVEGLPPGRALVVYGVAVESPWPYAGFSASLAQYDLSREQIMGNCFFFNRTEATIPVEPQPVRYFAFDVPAGTYIFSPFNHDRDAPAEVVGFDLQAGGVFYVGDFIFVGQLQPVELRRNLTAVRAALATSMPGIAIRLAPAPTRLVRRSGVFVCMP